MATTSSRIASAIVSVAMLFQLASCGTLIYPERKGNTTNVSGSVVVMDGLLCFLLIVPGVVAFIVDFSDGAIYQGGHR